MMQFPPITPVRVLPLKVQILGVMEVKLTGRPEVAVAEIVPAPPKVIVGKVPKLTV